MTSMITLGPMPGPLGVLDRTNRLLDRRRLTYIFRSSRWPSGVTRGHCHLRQRFQAQQEHRQQRTENTVYKFPSLKQRDLSSSPRWRSSAAGPSLVFHGSLAVLPVW